MNDFKPYRLVFTVIVLMSFLPFLWLRGDDLFTMLDAIAVSVGTGVLIAYMPGYFRWLWARRTTAGFLLAIGILATWVAAVGRLVWLWIWRLEGRPDDFFDHPVVAFFIYLFIVGGSLHLLANAAIEGEDGQHAIPMFGWAILGAALSIGFTLGIVLIVWA